MSEEAIVAQRSPYKIELEPGTYWWCSCGRSQKQPFCDGSHRGTGFSAVELKVEKKETYWLCGCKASKSQPHCDGAHNKL